MIHTSGASKEKTDENKIRKLVFYILNNIRYDARYHVNDSYSESSNVLSLATRKLAMCVGFSLGTTRALNLMGIPAYMITGHKSNGVGHAVVRAYYNNNWHTLDVTSSSPHQNFREIDFQNIVDRYTLYDKSPQNKNYNAGSLGTMTIDKDYEDWAELQKTEDLVLVNKEAILKHRNPQLVSEVLKQNLIKKLNLLKKGHQELNKKGIHQNIVAAIDGGIKTISEYIETIEKLSMNKKFFLESYTYYVSKVNFYASHLSQMAGLVNSDISENLSQLQGLADEADKLLKEEKLNDKDTNKQEEAKRQQEEAAKQAEEKRKQEEAAKQAEEKRKQEEAAKQAEEKRKQAEAAKQAEAKRQQAEAAKQAEEERKQEEAAKQAEAKRKQEEAAKQAEEKRQQEEVAKQAEEKRKQEEAAKQAEVSKAKVNANKQNEQSDKILPSTGEKETLFTGIVGAMMSVLGLFGIGRKIKK